MLRVCHWSVMPRLQSWPFSILCGFPSFLNWYLISSILSRFWMLNQDLSIVFAVISVLSYFLSLLSTIINPSLHSFIDWCDFHYPEEATHSYTKAFKFSVGSYCNCYLTFQFCVLSFPFYHISFPIFKSWQSCLEYFFYCPVRSLAAN